MWNASEANEMGRLLQDVGNGDQYGKRTKGPDIFFFINHSKVPKYKAKDVAYARIVCTIREMKKT